MNVIFTGSRNWTDIDTVLDVLGRFNPKTDTIFEGGHRVYEALGVPTRREMFRTDVSLDAIVWDRAKLAGFDVVTVWAPWSRLGDYAGPWRNGRMLDMAHALASPRGLDPSVIVEAFPLPGSKGTINMIELAGKRGVPVHQWEPVFKG